MGGALGAFAHDSDHATSSAIAVHGRRMVRADLTGAP